MPPPKFDLEESLKYLNEANSPCHSESCFHDLTCGHRIRTAYPEDCGANCAIPQRQALHEGEEVVSPLRCFIFICEICIRDEVHLQVMMGELDLVDSGLAHDLGIQVLAAKVIRRHMDQGARFCTPVKKMENGVLQYFDSFPEAHENQTSTAGTATRVDSDHISKRPGRHARTSSRSSGSTGHRWNPYLGRNRSVHEAERGVARPAPTQEVSRQDEKAPAKEEDAATKAVRELLGGLAIKRPDPSADEVQRLLAGLSFAT